MTIKKQFIYLSTIIVLTPVICALIVFFQSYLNDSKHLLINGSETISELHSTTLSENDIQTITKTFKIFPPDVQVLLIDMNETILYSSMTDLEKKDKISNSELLNYINNTSSNYFYQFTSPILETRTILITRIPKQKHKPERRTNIIRSILIFLIIVVFICIVLIIITSTTIFKAILQIKNKTQAIAENDLSANIITPGQKLNENEITSILVSLDKMRLSLLKMQNRKNQFIMGISHDLRTPVAIIKGYSEAITDGVISDSKEILNSVELIENKTNQLENMIDTLINFMKLNNSEIREKLIYKNITELIKDFAKDAELTGNVFKRKVITDIKLENEIKVRFNEMLVLRSFENLFTNAIRYTKDEDTIQIISFIENSNIILKIIDSGIGISEEDLPNIFEMFYRGTNSRREEGMGIGLPVVKNVMDTHGWKIDVKSEKNKGTEFTIYIPF